MSRVTPNTNKDIFESLIDTLKGGSTNLLFGNTKINITNTTKDNNPLTWAFRDASGVGIADSILPAMRTDRFQVGGVVDSVMGSSGISGAVSGASNLFFSGMEGAGNITSALADGVGSRAALASKKIEGYISPVVETLNAINNIGEEFDKIIKDTFLGRVFKLKGQEILCMMFCVVISLIPCVTRNKLYEAMMDIRNGLAQVNSTINEINRMAKDPVELPISKMGSLADNVASLFGTDTKEKKDWADSFTKDKSTKWSSASTLQVPDSVKTIVQNLVMVLTLISKGQITIPVGISGGMFDLAQIVMFVIRMFMVQMIDEFLTKIVAKVEKMLSGIMPVPCLGNIGAIFINKIMKVVKDLKNYLMELLKGLFGDADGFGIKWKKFGWYFKEIGDLLAMLKALQLVLAKFPDLMMVCGISPCTDDPRMQEIRNAINNGNPIPMTNIPANVMPLDQVPTDATLDDIARNFAGIINVDPGTIFLDSNALRIVQADVLNGAPPQIRALADTPEFLAALGESYTVYKDANVPDVTIVYTFNRMCGE